MDTTDTFVTFFVFDFRDNKGKIWYFLTTHPGNLIIRKMSSSFANSKIDKMDDDSVDLFQTQLGSSDWEKKFEEGWCSDSKYDIYI